MEQSINTPYVQLGMDVGMTKVKAVAKSAGILDASMTKDLNASFAIGTSTPSAIRMADAYATFAASGKQADPYSVTAVKQGGQPVPGFDKARGEAGDAGERGEQRHGHPGGHVIQNGTAKNAKALGRTAAGKTGTTDSNKIGVVRRLHPAALDVDRDVQGEPQGRRAALDGNGTAGVPSIHGGDIPASIWTEYMEAALKREFRHGLPGSHQDRQGPERGRRTVSQSDSRGDAERDAH
ncbi:hypothetical protein ACRAWF_13755 [Streptomyces sp. L7]